MADPEPFRADVARVPALARTAGILGELEAAICRELGTDQIAVKTRAA